MAELAVLHVASKILSTIASPVFKKAYEKVCSIKAAREELVQLEVTLETIRAVLLDAEKKEQDSAAIKNWIKRLRGVLYDAEDLVDEVTTDDQRKQQRKKLPLKGRVRVFFSNSHISRNSIAEKMKAIRKSLLGLSTDMDQFGFVKGGQNEMPMRRERVSRLSIDAKDVIGRDEDKRIILKMLFDESDDPLVVITVVGIGGMGKTALAKLVYDDEEIKDKFQKRWFSCISDISDEREVLGKIFRSISGESYSPDLDFGQLLAKIREKLEGQKYLLVLDNVWEDKRSKWVDRMRLLSYGAKGSRIIVTTRLPSVNKAMDPVGTHTLEGLSEDDSWNLFKRLAFGAEGEVDPEKERLGREILKKCCGVPLAIQSIGNLLRQEDSLSKWEAVAKEGLPKMGGGGYDEIMSVLKLSYDHLPSNLKHCFAYCSLFPKDDELVKEDLMNHWTALGYIESDDAESAFMYLLKMGFFQEAWNFNGELKSCKMHDLMHDLALYVAGGETVMLSSILPNNISNCARHVLVKDYGIEKSFGHLTSMPNAKSLRSLILRGRVELSDVFARFKYLRTLSLAYLDIENIPDSVGELKLMGYLNLKRTGIRKLPNSITNLVNLLSLDLLWCSQFEVWPLDFHKLVNLRYLNVENCFSLMSMPVGIGGMTSLHHLSNFITKNELNACDGLPSQLRGKLSITVGPESGVNLQSWQLPVDLQNLNLMYLGAECEITKWLTNGIGSTNNLARLRLEGGENVKYLPYLRFLPKLRWLQLYRLWGLEFMEEEEGNNITATSAFFPCLEELQLDGLPELKGWWRKAAEVTSSSSSPGLLEFPLLSKLRIRSCPQLDLKSLPPCPGVRVLKVDAYHVEMVAGRATTSSNPVSLGGLPKGKNLITDLNIWSEITCSVESCLSDISDTLLLLPIHRNFDEYMSIKLVLAHNLSFPWINRCDLNRIDVVEEARMPASSPTVLIIKERNRWNWSELSTTRHINCNHICSITCMRLEWLEEYLQRGRSNRQQLQMVSRPKFTDYSRTLLHTHFELLSQPPPSMQLDQFNPSASYQFHPGASTSRTQQNPRRIRVRRRHT